MLKGSNAYQKEAASVLTIGGDFLGVTEEQTPLLTDFRGGETYPVGVSSRTV